MKNLVTKINEMPLGISEKGKLTQALAIEIKKDATEVLGNMLKGVEGIEVFLTRAGYVAVIPNTEIGAVSIEFSAVVKTADYDAQADAEAYVNHLEAVAQRKAEKAAEKTAKAVK